MPYVMSPWRSGPNVDKEPFVADLEIGLAVVIHRTEIAYRQVNRTKEFKRQAGDNKFSSLSDTIRY
jgi:lipid A 3-O-deacylase